MYVSINIVKLKHKVRSGTGFLGESVPLAPSVITGDFKGREHITIHWGIFTTSKPVQKQEELKFRRTFLKK